MAFKRLIIEFGQGVDMHGGDQNNAVLKATKDAIHHCCMAGISEVFEITDRKEQARIHADIYVPHPEQADPAVVTDYLSRWTVDRSTRVAPIREALPWMAIRKRRSRSPSLF